MKKMIPTGAMNLESLPATATVGTFQGFPLHSLSSTLQPEGGREGRGGKGRGGREGGREGMEYTEMVMVYFGKVLLEQRSATR